MFVWLIKMTSIISRKDGEYMKRQPCIYVIRNIVNGKVYIGQTVRNFNERKKGHLSKLRRNVHDNIYLQSAFNKYGEFNMKFEILELCDYDNSDEREVYWINQYNSCDRLYGYNLESGGKNHKTLSEETKFKISQKRTGMTGKDANSSKMVICLNDMNIFFSAKDVSDFYGCNYGGLTNALQGRANCCSDKQGNYLQFEYYEPSKILNKKELNMNTIKKPKKVRCVNTGVVYETTRMASKKTGFQQSKISLVCNGKRGYHGKDEKGNPIKWEFV